MPAHSDKFPWSSYYGHYRKLETLLKGHSKVDGLDKLADGLYNLTLKNQKTLKLFIGECYSFGIAEFHEVTDNHGDIDIVLISSAWCGYGYDVKHYCRNQNIGVFQIGDFMAALNRRNLSQYLNEDETKYFEEQGWV